jgi:hypothetical protein
MNLNTKNRMQSLRLVTENARYNPPFYVFHLRLLFLLAVILFLATAAFSSAAVGAEPLSAQAIPYGFGVNIHFTGIPHDLKMIADAGFKFIRMDLDWSRVERTKGEYDFMESGYDALTLGCEKLGIRVLYILDYSNKLYESDRSVRTEAGCEAFADFAAAAAKRYAGKGVLWEIWNEPNIKQFWTPQPSMDDYSKLVEAAAPRIRQADPNARVLAGATSQIPLEWLEGCFKNGLLNWIDALSVHPYRPQPPETVIGDYARLRELIARYAPAGKKIPVISGEWGYSNINWDKSRLTEQQQANYLVRMFLINSYQNIPVSIWYDWKNDGTDPNEREHNFGTVKHDLNPKAAYIAAKVLSSTLAGYSISDRFDVGNENDFAFMLKNGDKEAVAFWTLGTKHNVNLPINPSEVTLIGINGDKVIINWKTERLILSAEQSPQYLLIKPK